MAVAGTYDVSVKTPMGEQKGTFTVVPEGDRFSGELASPMGRAEIKDGKVSGNRLTWKMNISLPMPLNLDCEASVSGDRLSGTVKAGVFGSMPLEGVRAG